MAFIFKCDSNSKKLQLSPDKRFIRWKYLL